MSIYYYSDLKYSNFNNYPLEDQKTVSFDSKVYKVLTYQVPSDWSYTKKITSKLVWGFLGCKQYQTEGNTLKSYFSKAFSRQRTKQVVVPQNNSEQIEHVGLPQVDKESRLGRLLYWKDILVSTSRDEVNKTYFLSKHFSRIPASSNFTKILLMPVYETRSTVVFLPSGSFQHVTEEVAALPEDKLLVLFYAHQLTNATLHLLENKKRLEQASYYPVSKTEEKKFRVFGLAQDRALPFPQELIDMLKPSELNPLLN